MAAEAAPAAGAAGAGGGAAGGGGAAAAGGAAAGGLPSPGDARGQHRGALLALGILLLWLAGVAFFFAFEGIQAEQGSTTGAGLLKSLIGGLSQKAQAAQQGGA